LRTGDSDRHDSRMDTVAGVPVRVHDVEGEDIGIAHMPWPISPGDVLELGGDGRIVPLRVTHLVETGQLFPIAALVMVECAPASARRS
jgi:hypothetical protein